MATVEMALTLYDKATPVLTKMEKQIDGTVSRLRSLQIASEQALDADLFLPIFGKIKQMANAWKTVENYIQDVKKTTRYYDNGYSCYEFCI